MIDDSNSNFFMIWLQSTLFNGTHYISKTLYYVILICSEWLIVENTYYYSQFSLISKWEQMPNPNHCEESIFVICNIKNNDKISCVVRQPVLYTWISSGFSIINLSYTIYCGKEIFFIQKNVSGKANNVEYHQTAAKVAVWSGSTLFS